MLSFLGFEILVTVTRQDGSGSHLSMEQTVAIGKIIRAVWVDVVYYRH